MELRVLPADEGDKTVLRRLLELYRYDFSEFDGADVDPHGEYGYKYLDCYWPAPERHPFLFTVDANWAGFALVLAGPPHDMAEFFVMRKYRRQGIGRRAAHELFHRFPGRWTMRQQFSNPASTAFWRAAIPYPYQERVSGEEVIQDFIVDDEEIGSRGHDITSR